MTLSGSYTQNGNMTISGTLIVTPTGNPAVRVTGYDASGALTTTNLGSGLTLSGGILDIDTAGVVAALSGQSLTLSGLTVNSILADLITSNTGSFTDLFATNFTATGTTNLNTLTVSGASIFNDLATFNSGATINGTLDLSGATLILPTSIADNGVSVGTDGKIELGGKLHQDTLIDNATFNFGLG